MTVLKDLPGTIEDFGKSTVLVIRELRGHFD
jgi:hypothetical protein